MKTGGSFSRRIRQLIHILLFFTMKRLRLLILFLLCLPFGGCGGDGLDRNSITGTITFDGKPVNEGFISFKPEPGTPCPDVAGQIKAGTFSIPKKDGPIAGSYTVGIMASAPTGRKLKAPMTGKESDEMIQIIPAQYTGMTSKSVLTATIVKGKNVFNFDLVSDSKP
jgi:hypothetical protein